MRPRLLSLNAEATAVAVAAVDFMAVEASAAEAASTEAEVTVVLVRPQVAPALTAVVVIALPRPDEPMERTVVLAVMALMVGAEHTVPREARQATAVGPAPFHHRARILAGRESRMVNGMASEIQAREAPRQPADPPARVSRAEIRPLPEAGILLEAHLRREALLRLA